MQNIPHFKSSSGQKTFYYRIVSIWNSWKAISRPECTNHTPFQTKMVEIDTLFQTKKAKKPYPFAPHKLM